MTALLHPLHASVRRCWLASVLVLPLLAGCEIPGLGPDPRTVAKESEAKAVGGACRHAMRGLEDCFVLNPKAPKAQVFAGWKEMDGYMRENKIEGTPSVLGKVEEKPATPAKRATDGEGSGGRSGESTARTRG
ncbi:hypothetical protein [Acidovorax sp. Leaf160]|uniref:hypothetical protein n=1 Tax=Acidovorax sp. Leaf160 TaxID=1736280 RepID=UPI0006F48402|nr:hypothetical protein [Acidovorax sp. Leaf160]KQR45734.1 hypothetical protein ASF94_08095 [Acidovorax sp. Leaf160]